MAELRLAGRRAASGLAAGTVAMVPTGPALVRDAGTPAEEARALREALATARAEAQALADRTGGEAAEMLAFQADMLADEELARPALAAIAGGASATGAWSAAMAAEIDAYRASADATFAARATDLEDIRDSVLSHLAPGRTAAPIPPGAVVIAEDLTLRHFLAIDWGSGGAIVLSGGSPFSHVAMLARARGVPMVVGVGEVPAARGGQTALVDADAGEVVLDPGEAAQKDFSARQLRAVADQAGLAAWRERPGVTADGTPIAVHLNIADPAELDRLDPRLCDGIGLVRTELLFRSIADLRDEGMQFQAYRRIAIWAEGRPVTIRTLDAGADKPIPGVTMEGESNPFLGLRGIRLSLRHPDLFRVQLRALARAAVFGSVRIMLPMVTLPREVAEAGRLLDEAINSLQREKIPARRPPLGIMVEVPAAAIAIDRFDVDFFSIGSNDLTQYVTAAGRDIGTVADLADPLNPAVLLLIAAVARHGREADRDVSLCGDAGADPAVVPHLLRAGLRSLSVAPAAVARAKQAIAATDLR